VALKVSDDEDDEKLGDPDGDTCSEKLSQTADNPSDKTGAQQCRLRSGTLLSSSF
jgi:transcription factor E2F7/8